MNIKAFMALAVVSLTAACASEDPKAVEEVQGVAVEEAAEAVVTDADEAAPEGADEKEL